MLLCSRRVEEVHAERRLIGAQPYAIVYLSLDSIARSGHAVYSYFQYLRS